MSNDKKNILKSAALMVATAMVLVVVTVAWFMLGGKAGADEIKSDVVAEEITYTIYEAIDTNKNGVLDTDEAQNWNVVTEDTLQLVAAVPNQYRFYKVVVHSGGKNSLAFKLNGISATPLDASAGASDIFERIHVRFLVKDDGGDPGFPTTGVDPINTNLLTLLGDPAPTNYTVYTIDLSGYQNRIFEIYYDVGLSSDTPAGDVALGSLIEIDSLSFEGS